MKCGDSILQPNVRTDRLCNPIRINITVNAKISTRYPEQSAARGVPFGHASLVRQTGFISRTTAFCCLLSCAGIPNKSVAAPCSCPLSRATGCAPCSPFKLFSAMISSAALSNERRKVKGGKSERTRCAPRCSPHGPCCSSQSFRWSSARRSSDAKCAHGPELSCSDSVTQLRS